MSILVVEDDPTDLKLPGMDGLAPARLLKRAAAPRAIPIVAVTAAKETYGREASLAAGWDAFPVKPVNTRLLAAQVTQLAPPLLKPCIS